jgi:predicted ATP-grasp superfamily ATP-dependent carboligase
VSLPVVYVLLKEFPSRFKNLFTIFLMEQLSSRQVAQVLKSLEEGGIRLKKEILYIPAEELINEPFVFQDFITKDPTTISLIHTVNSVLHLRLRSEYKRRVRWNPRQI